VAASAAKSCLTSNGAASEQPTDSLRSFVWKLIDGRWQMVFHQGTVYRIDHLHWGNETSPQIHHVSRIMEFLRYDPFPTPDFHADKLRKIRRALA